MTKSGPVIAMGKDMSRRCSHCGNNGHNARTCNDKGLKLFGVVIMEEGGEVMRKSKSMGNLSTCVASDNGAPDTGYLSDGLVHSTRRVAHERKRGVPWTEEEHRTFLAGLEKLGKGDWRGISRNFVLTKTPTQVASHAQKYFLRQSTNSKKKRRSSLFDMVINDPAACEASSLSHETPKDDFLLCNDILQACTSNEVAEQTLVKGFDASAPMPSNGAHEDALDFHGTNGMGMVGISRIFPSLSLAPSAELPERTELFCSKLQFEHLTCGPDFLQLSVPSLSEMHCLSSPTASVTTIDMNELELTIAPPRPFNPNKLSSGPCTFSGAIGVV